MSRTLFFNSLIFFLIFGCLSSTFATDRLTLELIVFDDLIYDTTLDNFLAMTPLVKEELQDQPAEQMLEEMMFLYSGMIYGFEFTYIPSNRQQGVSDFFELTPLGEIAEGDNRLMIHQVTPNPQKKIHYVSTYYYLNTSQLLLYKSWNQNSYLPATGRGSASVFNGPTARLDAYKEAIKMAIRESVRSVMYNRPYQLEGFVAIVGKPFIGYVSGQFVVTISVRYELRETTPYLFPENR